MHYWFGLISKKVLWKAKTKSVITVLPEFHPQSVFIALADPLSFVWHSGSEQFKTSSPINYRYNYRYSIFYCITCHSKLFLLISLIFFKVILTEQNDPQLKFQRDGASDVAQLVECLLSLCGALASMSSTARTRCCEIIALGR